MLDNNKSYRIRTNIGEDKVLNVNLKQNYDTLEILSLKLNQNNAYNVHTSNYGVIVGRVLANGGFGIPNAKISVFIPLASEDTTDTIKAALYPYNSTMSEDENGVKYNLLPDFNINECHQSVGTFHSKEFVLDNDNTLEIFDNYYKFTTRTNNAGDYMLFGVPTGNQNLHVDLDLSDIGFLSQRPRDLMYKGYNASQFENPNQFKIDTNLNSLSQLFSQDTTVNVYPFWGDNSDETIAVTRADIQIQYKFEPTCVFMGSVVSDSPSNAISKRCKPSTNMGVMGELTTGNGTIEMIRKTPQNTVEEFQIQGNELINGDGIWCYQIPMNLDYVVTDEYGNIVPTDDPSKGIPTRTKVRFRVGLQEFDNITNSSVRSKFLVPHNPQTPEETDYVFGTLTKDESYRDLFWNNVYTVKSYIPRFQKGNWNTTMKFTGFKQVNHNGSLNPIPYNNIRIKMSFMFIIMCAMIKCYIFLIKIYNWMMEFLPGFYIGFRIFGKNFVIHQGWPKKDRKCMYIGDGLCPDLAGWYFAPNCDRGDQRQNTINDITNGDAVDVKSNDYTNTDNNTSTCLTTSTDYFIQCIEINLAQEYKVIQFDFYNDWVNGLLYLPRWFREVRRKKNYLFGLITVKEKTKACTTSHFSNVREFTQQCAMDYQEHDNTGVYTKITNANGCDGTKQKCHKKGGRKQFLIFGSQGGAINDKEVTSDGIETHYFKPNEFFNNKKLNLFATDLVLLGSLNDCDLNGVPQAFKDLTSSSYQMPDNLATTNMDVEGYLYGTSPQTTVCNPPIRTTGITTITQDIDVQANNLIGTDSQISNIISDAIEKIPLTEISGIDWGYIGPGQDKMYSNGRLTSLSNNLDSLYFPGGHFLGISCVNSQTNIKSCVNLSRVCEQGVWLSQRQDKITSVSDDAYNYTAISPHGFITKDEISDTDFRVMFATMNGNNLKTTIDDTTGYLKYEFNYNTNNNFSGELNSKISGLYFTQVSDSSESLSPNETPKINYIEYRRALEEVNVDYYKFRLGLKDIHDKNYTLNKYLNVTFNGDGSENVSLPMYENSFYFYFGLHDGSTAIDEFNKQYYSNCITSDDGYGSLKINVNNIEICGENNSGSVIVEVMDMTPTYSIILSLNNNIIETVDDYNDTTIFLNNLIKGDYEITVIDVNNKSVSQSFTIKTDNLNMSLSPLKFNIDIDSKFNGVTNVIDKYNSVINDIDRMNNIGYGGVISTNMDVYSNGVNYPIGSGGELNPILVITNDISKTFITIGGNIHLNDYTLLTSKYVNGNIYMWKQNTEYQVYIYYTCNGVEKKQLMGNFYIEGVMDINFVIGNSGTINYQTHFRPYINMDNGGAKIPWWTPEGSKELFNYVEYPGNTGVSREMDMWFLKYTIFKEILEFSNSINIRVIYGQSPKTILLIGQGEMTNEEDGTSTLNPQTLPISDKDISSDYSLTLSPIMTPTYNYKINNEDERLMFGVRVHDTTYNGGDTGITPNNTYDNGYIDGYGPSEYNNLYKNNFILPLIYKPFYYHLYTWKNTTSENVEMLDDTMVEIISYPPNIKVLVDGRLRGNVFNGITYNEGDETNVKLIEWNVNDSENNWLTFDRTLLNNDDFYIDRTNSDYNKNGRVINIDSPSNYQLTNNDFINNLSVKAYNPLKEGDDLYNSYTPLNYVESNNAMFFDKIIYSKDISGTKLTVKSVGNSHYIKYIFIPFINYSELEKYNVWVGDITKNTQDNLYLAYVEIKNYIFSNFTMSKELTINHNLIDGVIQEDIFETINLPTPSCKYFTILSMYQPYEIDENGDLLFLDETNKLSENVLNVWGLLKQYNVIKNETPSLVFKININEGMLYQSPIYFPQVLTEGATIYWGDDTIETVPAGTKIDGNDRIEHTYASAGEYTITLIPSDNDIFSFGYYDNISLDMAQCITEVITFIPKGQIAMDYMFNKCTNLKSVALFDTTIINSMDNTFDDCLSLTNIGGFSGLSTSINIEDSPLITRDSILNIFNNMGVVTTSEVITLNPEVYSQLTDNDIKIATDKGWIIN